MYTDERNSPTESSTSLVETVGMYLFGIYHVVIIIVLINMLIAMMSHSFEDIQVRDVTEVDLHAAWLLRQVRCPCGSPPAFNNCILNVYKRKKGAPESA